MAPEMLISAQSLLSSSLHWHSHRSCFIHSSHCGSLSIEDAGSQTLIIVITWIIASLSSLTRRVLPSHIEH
ncbi:hypothetical protein BDW72DRAFT_164422 [Aspergillus terricola var. indicus]